MLPSYRHGLAAFALLIMASCAQVPQRHADSATDLKRPYGGVELSYKSPSASPEQTAIAAKEGWWALYNDPDLDLMIQTALRNNPDINQTRARLEQAAATARISAASLFPTVTLGAERSRTNGTSATPSEFSLSGAASYELDLWGKNAADRRAAYLNAEAGAEDLRTAAITLSSQITEYWLTLLALDEEERVIRKQIDVNKTVLDLQHKRYEMGAATLLDYLQQQEILARAEAQLPDILSQRGQLENAVLILMGENPANELALSKTSIPMPLPLPEAGLQSDLLTTRPDIEAAFLRLQSADWAKHAAWADRLPSFDIGTTASTAATMIDGLFEAWILKLAASITAPLIDGGARKAEELRQAAIADERFHAYRETVLTAVADVENALLENVYQEQKLFALDRQLRASRTALEQAQISYANGNQDYLNVLTSLTSVQTLERQMVESKRNLAIARILLYRALGGRSWVDNALSEQHAKVQK